MAFEHRPWGNRHRPVEIAFNLGHPDSLEEVLEIEDDQGLPTQDRDEAPEDDVIDGAENENVVLDPLSKRTFAVASRALLNRAVGSASPKYLRERRLTGKLSSDWSRHRYQLIVWYRPTCSRNPATSRGLQRFRPLAHSDNILAPKAKCVGLMLASQSTSWPLSSTSAEVARNASTRTCAPSSICNCFP